MGRLFYNMLVGALALVTNLGITQAQGQWMQPNIYSDSSEISLGLPVNRHIVKTVNGHVISLSADESGDISTEVIGFVPNQQNTQIQISPAAAVPSFAQPGMNQMAGPNVQTPTGANGLAGSANTFGGVGSMPSNPNIQQQTGAQPNNGPNGFAGSANTFGGVGSMPSNNPNTQQQTGAQPNNGPPFMNGGGFGNQQNSQAPANGGPINFPSNPPQLTSLIGGPQNTIGGMAPSVAGTGIAHIFRDSDEFHDVSVERHLVLGQDGRIQSTVQLSRDSNEYDDTSLEVNLNLLPQIRNLLNNQFQIQHQVMSNDPRMVFFQHDDQDNDMSLELQGILANPVFQQQIQEIDLRLKRAPAARSKRLMKKYAEALALSSTNTAPATINSSFFLSLLITWISVGLIL